jgi:uncharacterized protein
MSLGGEPANARRVVWAIEDGEGRDEAAIVIEADRFTARGRATNLDPEPYRLTYEVRTVPPFVTDLLTVELSGAEGRRRLELRRSTGGAWTAALDGAEVDLPDLSDALDCDLGRCPTTNSMPVLRQRLIERDEPAEFVMALVAVPELAVHRSRQRYVPLGTDSHGRRTIRFESMDSDFRSVLTFDPDGVVVDYPQLARRIESPPAVVARAAD